MSKESLIKYWKENFNFKEEIIEAFKEISREDFIPVENRELAYQDIALPTFKAQTISQPTTVMIMTNELEIKPNQKILEIGTGSGYQSAILSILVKPKGEIYTTEIVPELIDFAKDNLKNYKNIKIIKAKGLGYKKEAPYDRIIITAAAQEIPYKLLDQLNPNGIMIVPVGPQYSQQLLKITNEKSLKIKNLGDFVFVPLR